MFVRAVRAKILEIEIQNFVLKTECDEVRQNGFAKSTHQTFRNQGRTNHRNQG